jgi:hypothetical protein
MATFITTAVRTSHPVDADITAELQFNVFYM